MYGNLYSNWCLVVIQPIYVDGSDRARFAMAMPPHPPKPYHDVCENVTSRENIGKYSYNIALIVADRLSVKELKYSVNVPGLGLSLVARVSQVLRDKNLKQL